MIGMIDKEILYREYHPKVTRYVRSRIHQREDAEDIVSGVFVKVYANLDKYDPNKASISTWVYAITRNTVIDYFNRRKKAELPFDSELSYIKEQDLGNSDELLENLNNALSTLPELQQDIIILRYYFGLGHREISEKIGMSYANARKICSLAVAALREIMTAK